MKPALTSSRTRFLARFLGGEAGDARGACAPSASTTPPVCRRPSSRPVRGGGSRSRGCSPPAADLAAGRADLRARSGGAGDARRAHAAASGRRRPDRRGDARAARDRDEELRIGGAGMTALAALISPRHAPRAARRRRRADRRAVLPGRRHADAVRDRPRPRAAGAHRARRSSGSARCSRACSRSTACSRPTTRTARSI